MTQLTRQMLIFIALVAGPEQCGGQQDEPASSQKFLATDDASKRGADSESKGPEPNGPNPLPLAAQQLLRGMALMLLPEGYSDDDEWNLHKRVQSGLNVDFKNGELKTSRRWKDVRHGLWKRVDAKFVDPAKNLRLEIDALPAGKAGVPRYRIRSEILVHAVARMQQWTLGARIYGLSAHVTAGLELATDFHFRSYLADNGKLRVLPHIERATLRLKDFQLRRVSHAKGPGVRETGRMISGLLKRVVERKGQTLAARINRKVAKKPERFEIPGGFLFGLGIKSEQLAKKPDGTEVTGDDSLE